MGMTRPDINDPLVYARTDGVWDDFNSYTNGNLFTSGGTGGTIANNDGDGGLLTHSTGASLNNSAFFNTTRKLVTFKAGAPVIFQTEINYTEANTNNAMIACGFSSTWTGTLLQDTTGVPATSFSGSLIYKTPGSNVWSCVTSIGTTQLLNTSVNTCLQPGLNQRLIIQMMIIQSNLEVSFFVGTPGLTPNSGSVGSSTLGINVSGMQALILAPTGGIPAGRAIKHSIPYAGAAAMAFGNFLKAGSSTAETMNTDYIAMEFLARQ